MDSEAGTFTMCFCLPVVLGMLGSMSNSAAICLPRVPEVNSDCRVSASRLHRSLIKPIKKTIWYPEYNLFSSLLHFLPNRRIYFLSFHDIYHHSRFLGCLIRSTLFSCNIVHKATVLERIWSAAHRAMIKSNFLIELVFF